MQQIQPPSPARDGSDTGGRAGADADRDSGWRVRRRADAYANSHSNADAGGYADAYPDAQDGGSGGEVASGANTNAYTEGLSRKRLLQQAGVRPRADERHCNVVAREEAARHDWMLANVASDER